MVMQRNAARRAVEKKQARAVELVHAGLTFDEVAKVLGYANRGGAKYAYMAGLSRAALSEREAALAA